MPQLVLEKASSDIILFNLKMNIISWLVFETILCDVTMRHFSHYTTLYYAFWIDIYESPTFKNLL